MRVEDVLFRMAELFPLSVVTEYFLVLARQIGAVDSVMSTYGADTLGRGFNPLLLKKLRTQGSGDCLLP